MLKAGSYICPYCGHISDKAYYGSGDRVERVILKHTGGLFPSYSIEVKGAEAGTPAITLPVNPNRSSHGMPSLLTVNRGQDKITMHRCCPSCDKKIPFPDYGHVPIFVIALVGDQGTGKSVWSRAISDLCHLNALAAADHPYKLRFRTPSTSANLPGATPDDALGNTNYFEIVPNHPGRKDEKLKPVAGILLVDTAGESHRNGYVNGRLGDLLLAQNDYTPDAVLCFERAISDSNQQQMIQNQNSVIRTFNDLNLNELPLACIKTFPDRLLESGPTALGLNGQDKVPLFTAETFADQSYTTDAFVTRVMLENAIARTVGSQFFSQSNTTMGFLVQSCKDLPNDNDYSQHMNVLDPLLWLLYQLDLFPLIEMERGT